MNKVNLKYIYYYNSKKKLLSILIVNIKKTKTNLDAAGICVETTKGKYTSISPPNNLFCTCLTFLRQTKLLNTTFQYNKYCGK